MDVRSIRNTSDVSQTHLISAILHTAQGIIRWLTGYFTLTEEERLAAGVYLDYEERDE